MDEEAQSRLHATVGGRVQGVGFRAFVLDMAEILDLTGWVRNTSGGEVEVMAEGSRVKLEQLVDYLNRGPRGSWVSGVETEWLPATGEFNNFSVARTAY